jgi:hypothetical protein
MLTSGILRRVALKRTEVSEEGSASIIIISRIGRLGTVMAVTNSVLWLLFIASVVLS